MTNQNQPTLPTRLFNNRARPDGPLHSDLQDKIMKSSIAWAERENAGAILNPDHELNHGDLIPPGYLDHRCPRCGEIPDVALLSNGNKTKNIIDNNGTPPSCPHLICKTCYFVPEGLKQMPSIFQRTTRVSILDALQPEMYCSDESVSPQNLRFLQRHVTPDFFRGKNPIPELWRDLRIAIEQRKAYLHRDGNPQRRIDFEEQRLKDGLDPKVCRQRIIEFRAMNVFADEHIRWLQRESAVWRMKVTSFVEKLPRVSAQELEDVDCCICTLQYNGKTAETGPMEEAVRLPCSHVLGSSCLSQWLMNSSTCPTCRRKLLSGRCIGVGFNDDDY